MNNVGTETFEELFDQLGLDSHPDAIATFISQHKLKEETTLDKADFWTPAQRQFLRESWHQDSDWCVVIDQLNTLLRR